MSESDLSECLNCPSSCEWCGRHQVRKQDLDATEAKVGELNDLLENATKSIKTLLGQRDKARAHPDVLTQPEEELIRELESVGRDLLYNDLTTDPVCVKAITFIKALAASNAWLKQEVHTLRQNYANAIGPR